MTVVAFKSFSYFGAVIVLNSLAAEKIQECPSPPFWYQKNLSPYNTTLGNVTLRVVAMLDKDYIHKMQIVAKRRRVFFVGGVSYEILLALQHSLKFKYIPFKESMWIGNRNGTFYGIAPKIIEGWADIAIAEASMIMLSKPKGRNHSKDMQYIDCISYLHPTSTTKLSIILRQPDASSMVDIIFSTFSIRIWIAWIVLWGAIFLSVQFIIAVKDIRYTDPRVYYFDEETIPAVEDETEGLIQRRDVIMLCFSLFTGHGWYKAPSCVTIRNIFLAALIFAYLVNNFFSAALTSHLAMETVPIKSLKTLVASNLKVFGDRRLPYVRDLVMKILKLRRKKHTYSEVRENFVPVRDLHDVVVNDTGAFISFEDAVKSKKLWEGYERRYFCEHIYSLGFLTQSFPNAMFVRKGSPLREVFNRKILIAIERGVIRRIHSEYLRNAIITCGKTKHSYRGGLGVKDLCSAFSVLIGGMVLSFVALVLDKLLWSVLIKPT